MITAATRKPQTGLAACSVASIPLRDGRKVQIFVNQESGLIALDVWDADGEDAIELHRQNGNSLRGYYPERVALPDGWTSLDPRAPAMVSRAALRMEDARVAA